MELTALMIREKDFNQFDDLHGELIETNSGSELRVDLIFTNDEMFKLILQSLECSKKQYINEIKTLTQLQQKFDYIIFWR